MLRHDQALCKTQRGLILVLLEYWQRLCEGMAGMRQAWSSFSMAPRQKYGQDRGHVASAGPMGGQHCRGLGQSQRPVTGTWVCRAEQAASIAALQSPASQAIHEFPRERERDRARQLATCSLLSPATGLEPGWRAGPGPAPSYFTEHSTAQSLIHPSPGHSAV